VIDLAAFAALVPADHGLCVLSTTRPDGTVQSSAVNAGVLRHPVSGVEVVALVAAGGTRKLANLRADPRATIVVRAGWQWATVEGTVELVGPDDLQPWLTDADALRLLLRDVFTAAGGTHDNWAEYDATMAEQRRAVVLIAPTRVYSNG